MSATATRYRSDTLRGLSWYGGKSAGRHGGVVNWINGLIPHRYSHGYIEPYAGMLGVLLSRPRSRVEIVNDLNGRLVNWWKVIRDHPDEFRRQLRYTPHAESVFRESIDLLDDPDPITAAVAFHVVVLNSRLYSDARPRPSAFAVSYVKTGRLDTAERIVEQIDALADRLRRVTILQRPAARLLQRLRDVEDVMIYSDPPYRDAHGKGYAVMDVDDRDELLALYRAQRGRVAISGYGDEWDELEWHRSEFATDAAIGTRNGITPRRLEVLWTNFAPMQVPLIDMPGDAT